MGERAALAHVNALSLVHQRRAQLYNNADINNNLLKALVNLACTGGGESRPEDWRWLLGLEKLGLIGTERKRWVITPDGWDLIALCAQPDDAPSGATDPSVGPAWPPTSTTR